MRNQRSKFLLMILALLLVVSALLPGCGSEPQETLPPTEAATEAPVTEVPTEAPATEAPATEAPTEAPTEPPVVYTHPLTGETMDAPLTNRLFAVTINNVRDALPHYGVNEVDILIEIYANAYITRGLALVSNIDEIDVLGSVRSCRYPFIDLGLAYDAIVAHAGGSEMVMTEAYRSGVDHFNVDTSKKTSYSFRMEENRLDEGYAWEHCLFVNGAGMYEKAEKEGFRITQDADKDYGFRFTEDGTPADGETANHIDILYRIGIGSKLTTMTYNEDLGKYIYTQYGMQADEFTESEWEVFRNVLILFSETYTDANTYHIADLMGSGEGYYACGGKIIPIQWHRDDKHSPFYFTLSDGTRLEQSVGNTYMAIVPTQSEISYE